MIFAFPRFAKRDGFKKNQKFKNPSQIYKTEGGLNHFLPYQDLSQMLDLVSKKSSISRISDWGSTTSSVNENCGKPIGKAGDPPSTNGFVNLFVTGQGGVLCRRRDFSFL